MKKFTIFYFMLMSISYCFSQQPVQDPYSGMEMELSDDKQSLRVTKILPGSPADLSPLRPGARITHLDNLKVSEIADINNYFINNKSNGLKIRLTFGEEFSLPRVAINLFSYHQTEFGMFCNRLKYLSQYLLINDNSISSSDIQKVKNFDEIIQSVENPKAYEYSKSFRGGITTIGCTYRPILNPDKHNQISILSDISKDINAYISFDFDYSSQADPLLEKTLLNKLEKLLFEKGLVRNTENPDILIVISFYSGQKEQYVPPQQIISTKIYNYYNWYWGNIPVPVTDSKTKGGYTETSYLNNINLKFLDNKELATSKVPPIIWSASYSEVTKNKAFLSDISDDIFKILLIQYPNVFNGNAEDVQIYNFTYTGMFFKYLKPDLSEIADVIPGSPAEKAGIQKGDLIEWNKGDNEVDYMLYGSNVKQGDPRLFGSFKWQRGYTYSQPINFEVRRNGKKIKFSVNPESRKGILFEDYFGMFK